MNTIIVNKSKIIERLEILSTSKDIHSLRYGVAQIERSIKSFKHDSEGLLNISDNGDTARIERTFLNDALQQIVKSTTLERACYYVNRLKTGLESVRTNSLNDINLNRWKEYDDILTDSLWIIPKRDSSGKHSAWYWGNFVPQIPNQMIRRYTKPGEWVLDPFLGSGTTLLECQALNRNGIGLEINQSVFERVKGTILSTNKMSNPALFSDKEVSTSQLLIECGDSSKVDFQRLLKEKGVKSTQLLIMHPPYHDIIKFGDHPNDLSNQNSVDAFVELFGRVLDGTARVLDKGRYFVLVIGDKYHKGEWIPLGFYLMQEVLKRSFSLKSVIVKNFEETTGKRNQKELWRYRALVGGFYIFKHEYIFVFKKNGNG